MVIFTETMAKLVTELADKALKVTVSEDTVVFDFAGDRKQSSPLVKKPRCSKGSGVYTFNGETHTIKEWAEKYSVPYKTMANRLRNGSPETRYRRGKGPKRVKKG